MSPKIINPAHQSRVLNRLADITFKKGGLPLMKASLDKAMERIWDAVEIHFKGRTV